MHDPRRAVEALERVAIAGVVPDLTIILDLAPEEGLKRAHARRDPSAQVDRYEKEDISAHELRRAAFLKIAESEPERCRVVDASGEPEDVARVVLFLGSDLSRHVNGQVIRVDGGQEMA